MSAYRAVVHTVDVLDHLVGYQAGGLAHPVGVGPEVRVGLSLLLLRAAVVGRAEGERVDRVTDREGGHPGVAGGVHVPQDVLLQPQAVVDHEVGAFQLGGLDRRQAEGVRVGVGLHQDGDGGFVADDLRGDVYRGCWW
ncbi:hypothetical protein SALBM135S_05850 [Streptomyces alboniger]